MSRRESIITPLELLLPAGAARTAAVIGSGCPHRLRPLCQKGKLPADLVVVAPSELECRTPGWLERAVRTLEQQLGNSGMGYVLVPRRWRWRALRLLRARAFTVGPSIAHLPHAAAARQRLVPAVPREMGYALLQLGSSSALRRAFVQLTKWTRGKFLMWLLPDLGIVVRSGKHVKPLAWLDPTAAVSAVATVIWDGADVAATLHQFRGQASSPIAAVKVSLTPPVIDRAAEAGILLTLGPSARAAGAAVPQLISLTQLNGQAVLFESVVPGRAAATLLAEQPSRLPSLMRLAASWLRRWNELTVRAGPVDIAWLRDQALNPARRLIAELDGGEAYCVWLERLTEKVAGAEVPFVAAHNDLAASNLLVDRGRLGVVDWEMGRERDLPLVDFFYLVADLTAARSAYRDWPASVEACFGINGRWASDVMQLQSGFVGALDLTAPVAEFCFHACWLRRIARDYDRGLRDRWQPFLEIVRGIARKALAEPSAAAVR